MRNDTSVVSFGVLVVISTILFLLSLFPSSTIGAQILVDNNNPCRGQFNYTWFDISNVFQYPVAIENQDPRGYTYWFDPCSGVKCNNFANTAICQRADMYYDCGEISAPIWTFNGWLGDNPWNFTIVYPNGFDWRLTSVTFVEDPNQPETTIQFLGENPYLQYNFLVTGACVGQPNTPNCGTPAFTEEELMWWDDKFSGRL